ncbi:hypothetical protein [Microbacterium sp. 77mftsu3.1]|uniref:hypothetical protein n=1 Tax=Microbacterium sp. 77mftsu3.1 TaxID=1761802 RepID=UPI0003A7270A|nr:hypothetical protein [Microbacterium sp. 77mftsu3.1]
MDPVTLETPAALRDLTLAEAPFAGVLRAGEPLTVWVDAVDVAASPAWAALNTEHILAPIDAAATTDGPRVLLAHCPVQLDDVVRDAALSPGALVTVAVSALRGAAEADRLGASCGRWWVTTEGRPVLALTGTLDWRRDTLALLKGLEPANPPLRAALDRAVEAIDDPRRLRRESDEVEDLLFAAADPEPLPTSLRDADTAPPTRLRTTGEHAAGTGVTSAVRDLVTRLVDRGVADRVGRAIARTRAVFTRTSAVRGRRRTHPAGRRKVVLVAAAAATAVILAGALWPTDEKDRPAAAVGSVSTAPPRSASASPTAASSAPAAPAAQEDTGPAELVAAARRLVDAVSECSDAPCRERWGEESVDPGNIPAAAGGYGVDVVDEYGGAAAVKIVGDELTQVLVMVRVEEKWLVREVYDLADQP